MIYSILIGGIGSVILVVFLGGVLSPNGLNRSIPFIFGFNAAITGFSLLDKTRGRLFRHRVFAVASGGVMVALVCVLLIFTFQHGLRIPVYKLFIYGAIGVIFSGFGAWLAIQQYHLK